MMQYTSDSQPSASGDPNFFSRRTATPFFKIQKICNTHKIGIVRSVEFDRIGRIVPLVVQIIARVGRDVPRVGRVVFRVGDRAQFLTDTRANIMDVQLCMDFVKCLTTSGDPNENRWRPHVGSRPTGWEPLQYTHCS
jgi:hypothetical protein